MLQSTYVTNRLRFKQIPKQFSSLLIKFATSEPLKSLQKTAERIKWTIFLATVFVSNRGLNIILQSQHC